MTDDEYREYLAALASKYLRTSALYHLVPDSPWDYLNNEIERLSSTARFVTAVSDRSRNSAVVKALADELRSRNVDSIIGAMQHTGVLDALDEAPDITFANLRRSVIPAEDVRLLSHAGVEDPEAEITRTIHYSRKRLGSPDARPSEAVRLAQEELNRAADRVDIIASDSNLPDQPEKKRRKIFNGIGKILQGTITGAGNLLLLTGSVVAPNPATAYLALGSSAFAVGTICQGIGDLRGE
jgi:hypothetical protein